MRNLIITLNGRLDGLGRATALNTRRLEVTAAPQADSGLVDRLVTTYGTIEFRLIARKSDVELANQARLIAHDQTVIKADGRIVAQWASYVEEDLDPSYSRSDQFLRRQAGADAQTLTLIGKDGLSGDYMVAAQREQGEAGRRVLVFEFNDRGKDILAGYPTADGATSWLGLLVDGRLFSVATIKDADKAQGKLRFAMSNSDADLIYAICHHGMLPCAVRKVSQPAEAK